MEEDIRWMKKDEKMHIANPALNVSREYGGTVNNKIPANGQIVFVDVLMGVW